MTTQNLRAFRIAAVAILLAGCNDDLTAPNRLSQGAARRAAMAGELTVAGTVKEQNGTPFNGALVEALQPGTTTIVASATTDASGSYSLYVMPGSYDFRVTPPAGSAYRASTLAGRAISANTTLDFILVPAGASVLKGRVLGGDGAGVPNIWVTLAPANGGAQVQVMTDAEGRYSFAISPGDYRFNLSGGGGSAAAPGYLYLYGQDAITIAADRELDLPLPVHRIDVHVQDPGGVAVENVALTSGGVWTSDLAMAGMHFYGQSEYPTWIQPALKTDASGNAVMWLYPTPAGTSYSITATPPAGLPFGVINVPNVVLTHPVTKAIILQFAHAPPVTTASLSPAAGANGKWSGPVSVSLSATAAAGYSVSKIEYKLDGAAARPYSGPFEVSAAGQHTVEFWATDNSGVYELARSASFEIEVIARDNTPPVIQEIVSGTLGSNGWYVSDVGIRWSVTDAESEVSSRIGCGDAAVRQDSDDASFTCTATSAGGSAHKTISVKRDATAPIVSFAGNAAGYTVDQHVKITCSASDAMSGVASHSCVSLDVDAYELELGVVKLTADARDRAGNVGAASAQFTIAVTHPSLCALVERFVSKQGVAHSLCVKLENADAASKRGQDNAARNLIDAFINEVLAQRGKSMTEKNADVLIKLARAL